LNDNTTARVPTSITTIHTVKKKIPNKNRGNNVSSKVSDPSNQQNETSNQNDYGVTFTSMHKDEDNVKENEIEEDEIEEDKMEEDEMEELKKTKERYDYDPKERVKEVYDFTTSEYDDPLYVEMIPKEEDTGMVGHRIKEIGLRLNANLKETVGVGIGETSPNTDRQKADEHFEEYTEIVKENEVKEDEVLEVKDSRPIVHKIKEVAHNVNANLKEIIGVGFGNYSSGVDRQVSDIHKLKYDEKISEEKSEQEITK